MTADELQRWASILRWVGLSVTAIGLAITFGSHFIADKLLVAQRVDKAKAQERLKLSEAELEATKAKTAELAFRLAPRILSAEQRANFVKSLSQAPKGLVGIAHIGLLVETVNFSTELRKLLEDAGFTISSYENPLGYVITAAPPPWLVAIIVGTGETPPHVAPLLRALSAITQSAPPDNHFQGFKVHHFRR